LANYNRLNVGQKRVEQLWYVKIRYENFGKLPIKKDEIEASTKIHFAGSEVLSISVAEKQPSNLDLEIRNAGDSIVLSHGLINPTDYAVMDILISSAKAPMITCDYRIADIANCTVKDETASKEYYVAGLKLNDNLALLAVSIAFASAIFAIGGLAYLVGSTLNEWTQQLVARYRVQSIEDALSLYKPDLYDEIKNIKLKDKTAFRYHILSVKESIKKFLDDPEAEYTVGELVDRAQSQAINSALASDIQNLLGDLINTKSDHYFFDTRATNPGKLIDFEKDTISKLVSNRFRTDLSGIAIGLPLLILASNVAFVCAGPLRTLLQKWI
jgi:hypothetical protein